MMAAPLPPPGFESTGVGALPHRDPASAWETACSIFPYIPFVPTLPGRGIREGIVWCDSAHLPGRREVEGKLFVDTDVDLSEELERIYRDFLEGHYASYRAEPEYSSGFHAMLADPPRNARILKCQMTGPVTFGMQVTDTHKRPLFYDPEFVDVLGKLLGLQARWFEVKMREAAAVSSTLVILNEPYLATLGSSVVPLDRENVTNAIADATTLLEGSFGIHCCANTDWGFLLSLRPAVLSFDAYLLSREFLLYSEDIVSYLEDGGVIAWGIVPAEYDLFRQETVDSLYQRVSVIRSRLLEFLPPETVDLQSLITPTCGIRMGTEAQATAILRATAELGRRCRGWLD